MIQKKPKPMLLDCSERIARKEVYVAQVNKKLVGIIVLDGNDECMLLDIVAVFKEYQNMGIGKLLIIYAKNMMRGNGIKECSLYTNVKFYKNIIMYRHMGYEEYKRKEEHGYQRVFFKKKL